MPERLACDEAMRFAESRLRVQNADLKNGQVEMTMAGQILRPWGLQGGFAVVYKFRTQSGKMRALRCYLMPMKADIQYRYERIGSYFAAHIPDITAEFKYHNNGILITETVPGLPATKKPYSLIEMEWIDGTTLIDHVASLCQNHDQQGLDDALNQWVTIINALRQANIAHCDLAGGNIMVRSDGRLVLVDYDGVYIPEFQSMQGIVEGQADYQHPQMSQRAFNEHADNFSAMVVYTALLALSLQPALQGKYSSRNKTQDTHLLFKKSDFHNPDTSPLFAELEQINDTRLQTIVRDLKRACRLPIDQVQLSTALHDPDYDKKIALAALEQAIRQNDDEKIVTAWVIPLLDTYGPAQKYRVRLEQAQQFLHKLNNFRAVLQNGSIQQIMSAYDPTLDNSGSVTSEERTLLQEIQKFTSACQHDHDQIILHIYEAIQHFAPRWNVNFNLEEQQRITLARQRIATLEIFRRTLNTRNIQDISNAYNPILDQASAVTADERALLQAINDFVRAYYADNDQEIITTSETITQLYLHALTFTLQEEQRITLAQQRINAITRFQQAVHSKLARQLLAAYDPILDTCSAFTEGQRNLLLAANRFIQMYNNIVQAIQNNKDEDILANYDENIGNMFLDFTQQQKIYINKTLRYNLLEQYLQNGEYSQAIRFAQEIERDTRQQNTDFRLISARQKLVKQFEAKNVEGWRQNIDDIIVRWQWPAESLISHAVIVWRVDRWPQSPRKQEPGTERVLVPRGRNEQNCIHRFQATRYMSVYLQVYFAIPDYTQQPPSWFYADGREPSSKVAVYYSNSGNKVIY
ncbi:MAG TPA: AarF/UbiB family protein [Ktedonobacteraceae bacterium]|nr:AarF/UbiB family protein [Ktedonobacteraceae bacterium]